jgi:hypothetical protein
MDESPFLTQAAQEMLVENFIGVNSGVVHAPLVKGAVNYRAEGGFSLPLRRARVRHLDFQLITLIIIAIHFAVGEGMGQTGDVYFGGQ